MMRIVKNLFIACILLTLLQSGKAIENIDVLGSRFHCNVSSYDSTCIELNVLKSTCKLKKKPGESVPPEPSEAVFVITNNSERIVKSPSDLVDCVSIVSPENAIEYLRFFSSYDTVHMFQTEMLEVFPDSLCKEYKFVCMRKKCWDELKLHGPKISYDSGAFEIVRFIIKPEPSAWRVALYSVKERVDRVGNVVRLAEKKIQAPPNCLDGIAFPMFL